MTNSVFSIKGHDYTIDEIMALPDRALSMGGTNETHAKIDAERNIAFLTTNAGELIYDQKGKPTYAVIRKRGQTTARRNAAPDDMLQAIGNARRAMAEKKQTEVQEPGVFNITLILAGIAMVVVPAVLFLWFFMH